MKIVRLFLVLALSLAASMAHAQRANTGYIVPAVCPYPYGCDVYGNPFPPPYPVYMDSRPSYQNYATVAAPVAVAINAISDRRHGGVSVAATVLSSPGAVSAIGGIVSSLFLNVRR